MVPQSAMMTPISNIRFTTIEASSPGIHFIFIVLEIVLNSESLFEVLRCLLVGLLVIFFFRFSAIISWTY
jgi:hypothetical protein